MSVQSPFAERRARLGIVSRPIVDARAVRRQKPPTQPIPPDMFSRAHRIADLIGNGSPPPVARKEWRAILQATALTFDVTEPELTSGQRHAHITWARQCASWLMRRYAEMSWSEIARRLGGLDHSTVIYASQRIDRVVADEALAIGADTDWRQALLELSRFKRSPLINWSNRRVQPRRA